MSISNPYKTINKFITKTGQEDILILSKFVDISYWNELTNSVEGFINKISSTKNKASGTDQSEILLVIGEWGMGKSSLLEIIKYKGKQKNVPVIIIKSASELIEEYEKARHKNNTQIASVIMSLLIHFLRKKDIQIDESYYDISILLRKLWNYHNLSKSVIFCIDQFEDVIIKLSENNISAMEFLEGLWNYTNESKNFRDKYGVVFHFVLALTPEAFERYKQKIPKDKAGWDLRRLTDRIKLKELNREDSHRFLLGYLKYLYGDEKKITDLKLNIPFILDSIYVAGRGILGYMQNILENLITKLMSFYEKKQKIPREEFAEILVDALETAMYQDVGEKVELFDKNWYQRSISYLRYMLSAQKIDSDKIRKILSIYSLLLLAPYGITLSEIEHLLGSEYRDIFKTVPELLEGLNYRIYRFSIISSANIEKFLGDLKDLIEKYKEKPEDYLYDIINVLKRGYESNFDCIMIPEDEKAFDEIFIVLSRKGEKIREILNEIRVGLKELMRKYVKVTLAYKLSDDIYEILYPEVNPLIPLLKDKSYAMKLWRTASDKIINAHVNPLDLGHAAMQLLFQEDIIKRRSEFEDDIIENAYLKRKVKFYDISDISYDIPLASIAVLSDKDLEAETFEIKYGDLINNLPLILVFTKSELEAKAKSLMKILRERIMIIPIVLSIKEYILLYALKKAFEDRQKVDMNKYLEKISLIRNDAKSPVKLDDSFWEKIIERAFSEHKGVIMRTINEQTKKALGFYDIFIIYPENIAKVDEAFAFTAYEIRRLSIKRSENIATGGDIEDIRETEKERYIGKLKDMDLLTEVSSEHYKLLLSSVEKRILNVLKYNDGRISLEKLTKAFMMPEKDKIDSLSRYIMNTLARKGYVEIIEKDKSVRLIKMDELEDKIDEYDRSIQQYKKSKGRLPNGSSIVELYHIIAATQRTPKFITFDRYMKIISRLKEALNSQSEEFHKRRIMMTIIRLYDIFYNNKTYFEEGFTEVNKLLSDIEIYTDLLKKLDDVKKFAKAMISSSVKIDFYDKLKEIVKFVNRKNFLNIGINIIDDISNAYFDPYNDFYKRKGENIVKEFASTIEEILKNYVPEVLQEIISIDLYDIFPATKHRKPEKAHYFNIILYILKLTLDYIKTKIEQPAKEIIKNYNYVIERMRKQSIDTPDIDEYIKKSNESMIEKISRIFNLSKEKIKINIDTIQRKLKGRDIKNILEKLEEIVMTYRNIDKLLQTRKISGIRELYLKNLPSMIHDVQYVIELYRKRNLPISEGEIETLNNYLETMRKFEETYKLIREKIISGITIDELYRQLKTIVLLFKDIKELLENRYRIIDKFSEKYNELRVKTKNSIRTIEESLTNLKQEPSLDPKEIELLNQIQKTLNHIKELYEKDQNLIEIERKLGEIIKQLRTLERKYMNPLDIAINNTLLILARNRQSFRLSELIYIAKQKLKKEQYTQEEIEKRAMEIILEYWKKRRLTLQITWQ